MSSGWIILGILVILVLFAFGAYNRLVALTKVPRRAKADYAAARRWRWGDAVHRQAGRCFASPRPHRVRDT